MKQGEDPDRFILALEKICTQLRAMEQTVSDDMQKAAALNGLSQDYQTISVVARSQPSTTFEAIKVMVRAHYVTIKQEKERTQQDQVGVQHAFGVMALACYNCGQQGHIRRHCTNDKVPGSKAGAATGKWCAHHRTAAHSDAECKVQKEKPMTAREKQAAYTMSHELSADLLE
jgi:Zinc knuckle